MSAAVIVFPGSNCDRDCKVAVERSTGARVEMVWHGETDLPSGLDLIVLPGGFSYGDYLRCGAMAVQSPIMQAVKKAAETPQTFRTVSRQGTRLGRSVTARKTPKKTTRNVAELRTPRMI